MLHLLSKGDIVSSKDSKLYLLIEDTNQLMDKALAFPIYYDFQIHSIEIHKHMFVAPTVPQKINCLECIYELHLSNTEVDKIISASMTYMMNLCHHNCTGKLYNEGHAIPGPQKTKRKPYGKHILHVSYDKRPYIDYAAFLILKPEEVHNFFGYTTHYACALRVKTLKALNLKNSMRDAVNWVNQNALDAPSENVELKILVTERLRELETIIDSVCD